MKIELTGFAARLVFGVLAILTLTAIYGPTGWNVLTTFAIFAAYRVGQAVGPKRRTW